MAAPRNWQEAFDTIHQQSEYAIFDGLSSYQAALYTNLRAMREKHPDIIGNRTLWDLISVYVSNADRERAIQRTSPLNTADELWNAVETLDARATVQRGANRLDDLLSSQRWALVAIGSYRGEMLWLIPDNGTLPFSMDYYEPPTQEEANTFCSAIIYPDGDLFENKSQPTLCRCVSLGCIFRGTVEKYHKTGHALVIDVEEGHNLAAWLVLADRFPNDTGDMNYDGDDNVYVPQQVERGDRWADGVLSSDVDRTTVGKIEGAVDREGHEPVFRSFGRDFQVDIVQESLVPGSERGPELAGVVPWYWDPKEREEICYNKDGSRYMRFNPETGIVA